MTSASLDKVLPTITNGRTAEVRASLAALHAQVPFTADPATATENLALLRLLYAVARRDLTLARLFEGHVDALQIVARYAETDIVREVAEVVTDGGALGVWNAALPGEPLRIENGALYGGKSFASGAGVLSHALACAETPEGNRLVLIDLIASKPAIDESWWQVVGMQRSHSHIVRWDGALPPTFRIIAEPGDYAREPFFSGGALRFVACHAGGTAAVFDHVRNHLNQTGRSADPHQAGRMASLFVAANSAAAAVRTAGERWGRANYVEHVAAARVTVAACAERALVVAQQAVGAGGLFASHPLSTMLTDLMMYLRQPMPDAQRMLVGQAAAEGTLVPEL